MVLSVEVSPQDAVPANNQGVPSNLDALYAAAAQKYNIDPDLLRAQGFVESSFNPNATGPNTKYGNAQGVAQLIPDTAKRLGVTDPNDPSQAIDAQARLLQENLNRYGNVDDAVAAYHGGTDKANWGPKTQAYIQKVSDQFNKFKQAANPIQEANAAEPIPNDPYSALSKVAQGTPHDNAYDLLTQKATQQDKPQPSQTVASPADAALAEVGGYIDAFPGLRRIAGALGAGGATAINAVRNANSNDPIKQPLFNPQEGLAQVDQTIDQAKQLAPNAYYTGQGAGVVGGGAALKGIQLLGGLAETSPVAAKVGQLLNNTVIGRGVQGATAGGVYGGLQGADQSRNMQELGPNITQGAETGAAIGGAIPVGLDAIAKAIPAMKAVGNVITSPIESTVKGVKAVNSGLDRIVQPISERINRTGLPPEAQGLSNPEALYMKTLQDNGVTPQQALTNSGPARAAGVNPAPGVTNNVPQMNTQAYLINKATGGSKVAEDARDAIIREQIPKLNNQIIETATGGKNLSAEEYGVQVSKEAKNMVDKKAEQLKTRAKPYYQSAINPANSVPVSNPELHTALGNPVAREALDKFRTDPATLTNVQQELKGYGIDAADLEKLPYNSTLALHAARTNLREQADKAFRAGDTGLYKATKTAINDIDAAIESAFPEYATARRIYSEDSGALRQLKDSPIGKMSEMSEGDFSKIANDLMGKDAGYIKKFMGSIAKSGADPQKMRDALAGAYMKRKLEGAGNDGLFSKSILGKSADRERLKAMVGDKRFDQIEKAHQIIGQLLETKNLSANSITAGANMMREGEKTIPTNLGGVFKAVKSKIAPSLFDLVAKDPKQAAEYAKLLYTDEGYKLLDKLSGKTVTPNDVRETGKFLGEIDASTGEFIQSKPNTGKKKEQ